MRRVASKSLHALSVGPALPCGGSEIQVGVRLDRLAATSIDQPDIKLESPRQQLASGGAHMYIAQGKALVVVVVELEAQGNARSQP